MANTFRNVYKKTGNSGSTSDYQLVGNVGVNGVELDIMKGASSSTDGELGLVPKPIKGQQDYFLTGSGNWKNPADFLGSEDISSIGDGTIKGAIKELENRSMTTKTFTTSLSLASRGAQTVTFDIGYEGWYDIGIIEIDQSDNGAYLHISKFSTNAGHAYVTIQNTWSNTIEFDLSVRVLYLKNNE